MVLALATSLSEEKRPHTDGSPSHGIQSCPAGPSLADAAMGPSMALVLHGGVGGVGGVSLLRLLAARCMFAYLLA